MSSIRMKAWQARELCQQYLDYRDSVIAAKREPIIQKHMKRRWFGLMRPRTREEAIRSLENDDGIWSRYIMLDLLWSVEASYVIELLKATKLVDDGAEVSVSAETAASLYHAQNKAC